MRTLCGVVDYGWGKAYVRSAFWDMARSCLAPIRGLDIVVASDDPNVVPSDAAFVPMRGAHAYVEDMLMEARETMRILALDGGYDKILWQGIDALWQTRADVERILAHDLDIVAPLISARADSGYAVARRFLQSSESFNAGPDGDLLTMTWLEEQEDIPAQELASGRVIPSGFPGGDNIAISRDVLEGRSWDGKHKPWYRRVADGETNIECIEWFVRDAMNSGYRSFVDTGVKVWHCHEDGVARMWPGIEKEMGELEWST